MLSAGRAAFSDCRKGTGAVPESGSGGEKTGESRLFTNWKNAAPQIYCELIHAEKNRTLLSKFRTENFSISRSCTITRCGKPRAGCDNSDPRDAPGAVGNFGGGAGCPCLGEHPAGSAGAHRQPYGVFERGVRSNVSLFELGPLAEQFYLVSNRRGKLCTSACAIPACWRVFRSALRQVFM